MLEAAAVHLGRPPAAPALDAPACAQKLGLTAWHRRKVLQDIADRFSRAPFLTQHGAADRKARFETRIAAQSRELSPTALGPLAEEIAAVADRDTSWESQELLAQILEGAGRGPDAIHAWQRVINRVPHYMEAHAAQGKLLLVAGRLDDALAQFEEARRLRPYAADPYNNVGAVLASQKRWEEAEKQYEKALAVDPRSYEALVNLGMAKGAQGNMDAARTYYEGALRVAGASATTQHQLALFAQAVGLSGAAADHYKAALGQNPALPGAHLALGQLLRQQGRAREAAAAFEEGTRAFPGEIELWQRLASAQMEVPDPAGAIATYRAIHERWPEDWVATANLAWILATAPDARFRNGKDAVALAQEACRMTENREPQVLNTLAAAYAQVGRFKEALETAEQAMKAASAAGKPDLAQRIQALAGLYAQKRAYPLQG
jgi:tetratricopeptide (TPR) repeat protein